MPRKCHENDAAEKFPKKNFLDSGLWCHLDPRTFKNIIHDAYLYTQIGVRNAVVRIGVTFFFRCHFFSCILSTEASRAVDSAGNQ